MPRVCWVAPCRQYARVARHKPVITRHVGLMFGQHLRQRPSIIPTYIQRLEFTVHNECLQTWLNER